MSIRTQSAFFDGLQDNWFHANCFWGKLRGKMTEGDIRGMDNLKWEDQEQIRAKIGGAF